MPRIKDIIDPMLKNLVASNPAIKDNPMTAGMMDVLESGDAKRGEQMAENICNSMGVTKDEALNQARRFFGM